MNPSTEHRRTKATAQAPNVRMLAQWLGSDGHRCWDDLLRLIADRYPGRFTPRWRAAGPRREWELQFRRRRSFCTLVPGPNAFVLRVDFDEAEQDRVRAVVPRMKSHASTDYLSAPEIRGRKVLNLTVDHQDVLTDALELLGAKCPPKWPGR